MESSAEDHVLHLLEAIADEGIHPLYQAESYKLILIEEARLNQRISDLHEKFEDYFSPTSEAEDVLRAEASHRYAADQDKRLQKWKECAFMRARESSQRINEEKEALRTKEHAIQSEVLSDLLEREAYMRQSIDSLSTKSFNLKRKTCERASESIFKSNAVQVWVRCEREEHKRGSRGSLSSNDSQWKRASVELSESILLIKLSPACEQVASQEAPWLFLIEELKSITIYPKNTLLPRRQRSSIDLNASLATIFGWGSPHSTGKESNAESPCEMVVLNFASNASELQVLEITAAKPRTEAVHAEKGKAAADDSGDTSDEDSDLEDGSWSAHGHGSPSFFELDPDNGAVLSSTIMSPPGGTSWGWELLLAGLDGVLHVVHGLCNNRNILSLRRRARSLNETVSENTYLVVSDHRKYQSNASSLASPSLLSSTVSSLGVTSSDASSPPSSANIIYNIQDGKSISTIPSCSVDFSTPSRNARRASCVEKNEIASYEAQAMINEILFQGRQLRDELDKLRLQRTAAEFDLVQVVTQREHAITQIEYIKNLRGVLDRPPILTSCDVAASINDGKTRLHEEVSDQGYKSGRIQIGNAIHAILGVPPDELEIDVERVITLITTAWKHQVDVIAALYAESICTSENRTSLKSIEPEI